MPIEIDLGYVPRPQFVDFHRRKQRWACLVCHRRAGKTVACICDLIDAALCCDKPDGRFAYVAPTYTQAKDIAWGYLKRYSLRIPGIGVSESDLSVIFPNDARVRLYGAENYDRMRGIYLDGVVLDEYAMFDPRAWPEVIRPALSDREGWAVFLGTPKGNNAFYKTYRDAQGDEDWYSVMLKASATGILPAKELADARKTMSEDQYQQEYECSFDAAIMGAYYGKLMGEALEDGRITRVPYDPSIQVETWWDLGVGDSTVIWFAQRLRSGEVRMIDYYEASGEGLAHYVRMLAGKHYVYDRHIAPHDIDVRELGTGKSRREAAQELGLRFDVAPRLSIEDGIEAVRVMLPMCWFDAQKCSYGIEALKQYRAEYIEKMQVFKDKPLHDWSSHCADAFRYGAIMPRAVAYSPISYGMQPIV